MKRTFAAVGLLVLGLVLGSSLGALAGRNLAREAEAIDQSLTSFAPIDVGVEETVATTGAKPLRERLISGDLTDGLIIVTDSSQGTNSEVWRWDPLSGSPERIPHELPVDAWWYDARTGRLLGTLSDPATQTITLISGPIEGPFEEVASGISSISPALDELPRAYDDAASTLFGGPLTERVYSQQREDGLYLWSADYSGATSFKSQEIGPFQIRGLSEGIQKGAFPGGAYIAVLTNEGTTVTTFIKGEIQQLSLDRAVFTNIGPPDFLVFQAFDGFLYLKLSTQEVTAVETLIGFEGGCAVFASDSNWTTCQLLGGGSGLQTRHRLDTSVLAPGRMIGFLPAAGLSFSHRPGLQVDDRHALVALDENAPTWVEIGFFDSAIYGVWSER